MKKRRQKHKKKAMSALRKARIDAGYSMEQAAHALHLHPSTLSRYETGRVKEIPQEKLAMMYRLYAKEDLRLAERIAEGASHSDEDLIERFKKLDKRGQILVSALMHLESEWSPDETD